MALLPADAFIRDRARFGEQLKEAFRLAAGEGWEGQGPSLLTFAVKPTRPETGFGYLELGAAIETNPAVAGFRRVKRFVEKPDASTAQRYVSSGDYAWNAGLFVWKAESCFGGADSNPPPLAPVIRGFPKGEPSGYLSEKFPALPKISVDFAILEKAKSVVTLVARFDWDDVGSWNALPEHLASDASGNAIRGTVASVNSSGNIAVSNGRVIALCGVRTWSLSRRRMRFWCATGTRSRTSRSFSPSFQKGDALKSPWRFHSRRVRLPSH